jgi:hypothetical protein
MPIKQIPRYMQIIQVKSISLTFHDKICVLEDWRVRYYIVTGSSSCCVSHSVLSSVCSPGLEGSFIPLLAISCFLDRFVKIDDDTSFF